MRPARSLLATLAAIGTAASAPPAAAAERAALILGGELTRQEEAPLRAAAVDAVQNAGWSVIESNLAPSAISELLACVGRDISDNEGCLVHLFAATRADRAVILRVRTTRDQGETVREMSGWVFRPSGKSLKFGQRFCNACREGGLETSARILVATLVRSARARARPSRLLVRSNPPGAEIQLDGKAVGVTDMDFSVYPGRHTVELNKEGFHIAAREVTVDDGERVAVDVPLQALEPRPRESPGPSRPGAEAPGPGLLPWAAVGAGAAGLIAGGVLLAIDERESEQSGVRDPDHRETTALGIGLGGAGAAAVAVGVYLLLRDVPAEPVVSLDGRSAWFGVAGSF